MSKNGKSDEPEFQIAPHLEEMIERGYAAREAIETMTQRLKGLVDDLREEFPEHEDSLMKSVRGQWERLLSEREEKRRWVREAQRPKGDTDGDV